MSEHKNFVKMTVSGTPGTGTITLGSAVSGFQSFASAYGANATVDVSIVDGTAWEVARDCTYTNSGTTLTRGTFEASSTGSALSLTSAAVVTVTATAGFGNELEMQLNRGYTAVANSSGTTQTSPGAGTVKITTPLNTVSDNPYTWWDTTNKQFLPTRTGNYLVFGGIQRNSGGGVTTLAVIRKNGTGLLLGPVSTAANSVDIVSGVLSCNGTSDYIDLAWYTSASLTTITNADAVSFRTIYLGP